MENLKKKFIQRSLAAVIAIFITSQVAAEEKIIKQESITFEKCLAVITTSEGKLSIEPDISDVSDQKRVAVFQLMDGTLTITCDGVKGTVTVSTNTD